MGFECAGAGAGVGAGAGASVGASAGAGASASAGASARLLLLLTGFGHSSDRPPNVMFSTVSAPAPEMLHISNEF